MIKFNKGVVIRPIIFKYIFFLNLEPSCFADADRRRTKKANARKLSLVFANLSTAEEKIGNHMVENYFNNKYFKPTLESPISKMMTKRLLKLAY
jgi:hypothetical protein